MNVSFMPKYQWTPEQLRLMKLWFKNQLIEVPRNWTQPNDAIVRQIHLWIEGRPHKLAPGYWERSDGVLYIGQCSEDAFRTNMSESARLGILTALINLFGMIVDPDVMEWLGTGVGRSVNSIFNTVKESLIVTQNKKVEQLALKEGMLAVKVEGEWVDSRGVVVPVDGSWVVVDYLEG